MAKKHMTKEQKLARKKRQYRKRIVKRSLLTFFTVILLVVVIVFGAATVVILGPSQTLSDYLILATQEASATKWVAYIYFTDEEVAAIKARNTVIDNGEEVDTSLVVIPANVDENVDPEGDGDAEEEPDIHIDAVRGSTFNGYMMVVKDPSRVSVGVCNNIGGDNGMQLAKIAEKYGAIGAVNAGAFEDPNGVGNGGKPIGPVISQGKIVWNHGLASGQTMIGITKDNKLVFGGMNAATAYEKGVRDCVAFGPALIKNGKPMDVTGAGSGLNPRTAIGQRADGAILLLVVNGRKVNSLGASYADLIEVMLDYGAVNAANLDGGTSSFMYYDGKLVNDKAALYGTRKLPTAWIVK